VATSNINNELKEYAHAFEITEANFEGRKLLELHEYKNVIHNFLYTNVFLCNFKITIKAYGISISVGVVSKL